ncbi:MULTISPECIES: ExeM/NucH family extracellular endonuclease [Mameliella]|nr:ExeM/NucH family extracellular endonuclease [Mameliella sp. LZ-28]
MSDRQTWGRVMVNFNENFDGFGGAGFAPTPGAGQLDSDIWRVSGLSEGATSFGGSFASGDFARGTDADGGVSTGGAYAFEVGGNTFLGFQPTGSDMTPGTITLKITNTTGAPISSLDLAYDIMVNNDQARANTLNFAWSLDDATYTPVALLDYTSAEAADALGFQTVARSTTLTGFTLQDGESIYLQWQTDDVSGSGSRDEIGLDNIVVTAAPTSPLAFDLVNGTSSNLTSFAATPDNSATNGAFVSSFFDVFGITDRTVNFDFADDTTGSFAADTFGIAKTGDTAPFFGIQDLDNADNPGGTGTATWTFDVSGGTIGDISIDFAAMGDFESGDNSYTITVQLDGLPPVTLFQIDSDDSASLTYTLESGTTVTLNDPLKIDIDGDAADLAGYDGTLTNDFTTYASSALNGMSGSTLTVTLTAGVNNGGGEAFAMRDIVIDRAGAVTTPELAIAATDADKLEGDSGSTGFTFTVTRSGDTTAATTVDYAVSGGGADAADFGGSLPSGTVSFAAGETSKTITVQVTGDTDIETDEGFTVTLSNASGAATISTATATGTIRTDDIGITAIHDIQGATDTSPLVGQTVTVEAVVVGDFQDGDADAARNLRGFYLQEEDGDADGNVMTSEGIFVFDGSLPAVDVNIGDVVQVTGTVGEYFGETQISNVTSVTVIGSGAPLPTAAEISLPAAGVTTNQDGDFQPDLEAYEGMRVTFPDELTISEMYQLDRFNEIKLMQGGRVQQFTQTNAPDALAYNAFLQDVGARTITYDDGLQQQNALIGNLDGFGPTFSTGSDIRMGDTITGLSGVLNYQWAGNSSSGATWRVISTVDGENSFDKESVRPVTPEPVGGTLKVTSLNVLNFFATVDDGGSTALGFDPRGADSVDEYNRQLEKLGQAILEMDADILGLVELENDFLAGAPGNAIEQLVEYLNAQAGAGTYAWVDPGTRHVGSDAIAVGVIYKTDTVRIAPGTTVEVLTDADLPGLGLGGMPAVFDGAGTNRAPLAVTFEQLSNGATVNVVVTHMKSKGSAGPDAGDADTGDGQGFSNGTRLNGVTALNAWLDTDPTGSGDKDILVLGDLNAYAMEDPITYLEGEGYTDLVELFQGPDAYSYVFDGLTGTLDYAFANEPLTAQITGTSEWAINADEPDALDYNLDFGKDGSIFDGSVPFRTSDHDPILVGLALDYEGTVVSDTGDNGVWASYVYTYSGVDGSRIGREISYDDGSQATDIFVGGLLQTREGHDLADANKWDSFVNTYDASGNVVSRVTVFDDGRTATNTYSGGVITERVVEDTGDDFIWTEQTFSFDASGNITSLVSALDDGMTVTTNYAGGVKTSRIVEDSADSFEWTQHANSYDASGQLTERVTTYDDGRVSTNSYADGVITSRVVEDVNDAYDWHRIDVTYDAAGNVESRSFVWDSDLPVV